MLWKNSFTFPGLCLDDPWPTFNWENPNVACSLLLFSSPDTSLSSESCECCVSCQSHQFHTRRKNTTTHTDKLPHLLLFTFPAYSEKGLHYLLCKGIAPGPHILLFFYYESLIFSSHCFQRQYSILLMKYFTYICSDLINTPELEVHQCYWKYLFELSFSNHIPPLSRCYRASRIRNHSKEICIAVIIKVNK